MPTTEEIRSFDQQVRYIAPIQERLAKVWQWLDPVATQVIRGVTWISPKLAHVTWKTTVLISCKKDATGVRHYDTRYCALNLVKIGLTTGFIVLIATPAYYYSTWATYQDVYVPTSGVFVNEQFTHPSEAGQVIAPRDEIYTVLGHVIDKAGQVEPVRFDIDFNALFFFYNDAIRPDLAAAKLDSQSPYGVKCTFEATGIYNRLPRMIRIWALKWWDVRPEIVRIIKVEELKSIPAGF
jgi:hypothetical protein